MTDATLRIFRGNRDGGETADYNVPIAPGMVVLDDLGTVEMTRCLFGEAHHQDGADGEVGYHQHPDSGRPAQPVADDRQPHVVEA